MWKLVPLLALPALACFDAEDPEDTAEEADTDADSDADTDTDTDADADADADSDTDTDIEGLEPAWANELEYQGGCSDVIMYAWNPDDTIALFFRASGVAETAHAAGEATEFYWTLPDPEVDVWVERGEHLTHMTCNDAKEFETVVDRTWVGTEGSVFLTVTPTGDSEPWGEFPALGELELSGIRLDSGHDPVPPHLSYFFISTGIGWLPG